MVLRVRDLLELCFVVIKTPLFWYVYIFTFYTAVQKEGLGCPC
jgi:hypothetical protein